ncbi:hypothetical protein [Mycoplasmopsis bovis]|uniref:Transmembrane protein n=3 Tax=Mycoplasmopsis bovis TaxID=28903 RepID=A0A059Y8K6_MYCBV|nr:hypothetical protein [Mycoplasmopsis bovis]AEI90104.1 hypothetical protein MMB_0390 [Mycoplasmopsis bovis Hubei-1]AIA33967.1 hypothetical protein K668_01945 [Mycoplasmopsis bovis CQ-W70]AKO50588.1 hypothetical protein AAV31_02045 [Mycoplasmopsis bovis]AQU85680.1 hypothetical protein B0W43_02105 [Mycoplasmopsis bovis]ATQ40295.1 hypothetical protein B8187_02095 [Mycoplasmopsis bovis]
MKKNVFKTNKVKIIIFSVLAILSIVSIGVCSWIIKDLNTKYFNFQEPTYWQKWFSIDVKGLKDLQDGKLTIYNALDELSSKFPSIKNDPRQNHIVEFLKAGLNQAIYENKAVSTETFKVATKAYNALFGTIIGLSSLLFITSAGFIVNSSIELMYLKATPKAQQ